MGMGFTVVESELNNSIRIHHVSKTRKGGYPKKKKISVFSLIGVNSVQSSIRTLQKDRGTLTLGCGYWTGVSRCVRPRVIIDTREEDGDGGTSQVRSVSVTGVVRRSLWG